MMTKISGTKGTLFASARRGAVIAALAALGAVGCSSSAGKLDEYVGTWTIAPETSTFTLTCPTTVLSSGSAPFSLWTLVTLEEGTVSDLAEVSGACPTYYDVTGTGTATLASPDPFTGEAPRCLIDGSQDRSLFLEFQYTSWKITLQMPVKGHPPHGQMIGNANVALFGVDENGGLVPDERGDCSYVAKADLIKVSKD